jgi:hypothetical protein
VSEPEQVFKAAWLLPLSREFARDAAPVGAVVNDLLARSVDRWLRPWRYPDPNPFPTIVLFPRLARLATWFHRVTAKREDDWEED